MLITVVGLAVVHENDHHDDDDHHHNDNNNNLNATGKTTVYIAHIITLQLYLLRASPRTITQDITRDILHPRQFCLLTMLMGGLI